jgi:predicted Fe-S protein YdhL (DUF1289 family)
MEKTGENHHEIALACPDCGRVGSIVDGAASYICPGCGRLWDEQSVESWNKLGWPRPEWVLKGTKRPEAQRQTLVSRKQAGKDTPLHASGLLGPVTVIEALTAK